MCFGNLAKNLGPASSDQLPPHNLYMRIGPLRESDTHLLAKSVDATHKGGAGEDLPTITLARAEIGEGISAAQLFVKTGLAASGKEAKRLINEGGARINDEAIKDPGAMLKPDDFQEGKLKLSAGKKRHALAVLE